MATKTITCQSALHSTRAGLNDGRSYSNNLGTYDGVIPPPLKCERCAAADAASDATADDAARTQRLAALAAFRAATGLTVPQIRALFDARDKGDV